MTYVSCCLFPMHVSAACVCTVPDVDACALSPLVVEFERFVASAGAPPDKEIGSDAAGRHPASPLVAGALDAIIRGNRVREGGRLLVVFSTRPYEEVIFGQRRPDSMAIDWNNKMVYVLEFKRTSDQRKDYREKGKHVQGLSMMC